MGRLLWCTSTILDFKKHCEIFLEDGLYRIRDLGSTNKTFVNDTEISTTGRVLDHMDMIRLSYDPGIVLRFITLPL